MRILQGHTGGVRAMAYHPDGELLASGGEDGRIVLWKDFQRVKKRRMPEHEDWVRGIAFSPDGSRFASVGWDSRLIEWAVVGSKKHVREYRHHEQCWSVAYSPDGSMLASGSGTGVVRIHRPMIDAGPLVLRGHSMPITGRARFLARQPEDTLGES